MRDFLRTHRELIMRVAGTLVRGQGGRIETADLAHDVIVHLLVKHEEGAFDPLSVVNAEAYLRVVMRNALRRRRHQERRCVRVSEDGDMETMGEGASRAGVQQLTRLDRAAPDRALDVRRTFEMLVRTLRPRDARALELLVKRGMPIDEVAATLATSVNNIYQMRHRILCAARALDDADEVGGESPAA
jgi:RNA polymerase sigma factor (sigma-70 family)